MLIGSKSVAKNNISAVDKKMAAIKNDYQIDFQYLEKLLNG